MEAKSKPRIVVADDHPEMLRLLGDELADAGYEVELCAGAEEALGALRRLPVDVILSDVRMGKMDGFALLERVRAEAPHVPVILMTAFGAIETAIQAIKQGAFHFVTKPLRTTEVLLFVERALADRRLRDDSATLRRLAARQVMIGDSQPMQALRALVQRLAASDAPVLVLGESGTGKELVAKALHAQGARSAGPFVAINCTALPEALLESELFGHARGAFTGANVTRRGLFVEADGGTLFLDEIGDMPPGLQPKLLRVLDDGEVRPIGADAARRVDVRIVTATNQDLEQRVRQSAFRADLFYRLNVVPITVPPLRERPSDVELLVAHFLAEARAKNRTAAVRGFSPALIAALKRAPWPGNVRELENVVERLVILSGHEVVDVEDLERHAPSSYTEPTPLEEAKQRLPSLKQLELDYIGWVIAHCGGNKTRAAEILGIDVSTIHRREKDRPAR
jgi:two-component system response regulator HydG